MAIDSHSHIFDEAFDEDRLEVIQRIKDNHVNIAMVIGYSTKANVEAFELSQEFDFLYPTAGLHPDQANNDLKQDLSDLEAFIKTHKVYAIGECGLDYYWVSDNKENQKYLFKEQIKLAIKYNLPLVIHSRDAIQDTYDILEKYKGQVSFVMHCYSGSYEMAQRFIELGGIISLGGPVTFKNAKVPKEVATKIDINKLLVETDCPYLAPTPFRGKRNEPAYVQNVIDEIANLKGLSHEEVEKITETNAINFFKIKK